MSAPGPLQLPLPRYRAMMSGRTGIGPVEVLPSRKTIQLLARSSRYIQIYLGEAEIDWRHYSVPKWVVILPNNKKQPVNWIASTYNDRVDVDWNGRLIGDESHLGGPYEQYQYVEGSAGYPTRFDSMHESFKTFDPMPVETSRTFANAREWKLRFCNPHTFLGQTQQAAADYFLGDAIPLQEPKLIDKQGSCRFLDEIVANYPIFCSLVEVCEMDSLMLLMSTCRYVRRRILDTPSFWKEINMTTYHVDRKARIHVDYRLDTISDVAPNRAGRWSGSPLHVLSGLMKLQTTSHWLQWVNNIKADERLLSGLPLGNLTRLILDGSEIHYRCWYHIQDTVLSNLTFLSLRWCRNFSLWSITFDVLGEFLEEARQRAPIRSKPKQECKLKTLRVWGVRGETNHYRRANEPRGRDIITLYDSAGSSRFRINGNGIKALFIQYCAYLGITSDFGYCIGTKWCCWNDQYIKEGNFDYGMVDAESLPMLYAADQPPATAEDPIFGAPGYLAERYCSRCERNTWIHLCRECEEARTCYICLRYICFDCDKSMSFATRPLDWRDVRSKTPLPDNLPKKYCVSNCCNYCVNAGRFVCVECNVVAQAEMRDLLLTNCTGCTCNHLPEDFCPIRIPIDTTGQRHARKHLTRCGVDDCTNLLIACKNCDNGKEAMDLGMRCNACAIPLCQTCARTPCSSCPITYDRLCPTCVVQHTCTCYHNARRTSKRKKKGKGKAGTDDTESKPSNRKTHQPGCPLRDIQTNAEKQNTTTLRYQDRYVLPGGEIRSERPFADSEASIIKYYPKVKLEPACDDCGIAWWSTKRYDDVPIKKRRNLRY